MNQDRAMRRPLLALSCLVALAAAGCQSQDLAKKELKTEAKICTQLAAVGQAPGEGGGPQAHLHGG